MIEIKIEGEEILEKKISGNAGAILSELACIVDMVLEDVVAATNNEKTKGEIMEFVNKALKNCWEHENK